MFKTLVLTLLVCLLIMPAVVKAEGSIVQEYCEQVTEGSYEFIRIVFSIVNFNLPEPVCDLHFTPEPYPAIPGCEILECYAPAGWSCALAPGGGADYWADTPNDCIPPGTYLNGFELILQTPDWCCYVTEFTGPAGEVMLQQEECFLCTVIDTDKTTWGSIKSMYNQ